MLTRSIIENALTFEQMRDNGGPEGIQRGDTSVASSCIPSSVECLWPLLALVSQAGDVNVVEVGRYRVARSRRERVQTNLYGKVRTCGL